MKLTCSLEAKLSAQERSVVQKRHMKDAVAVKKKLTEQIMQLSMRCTELEGEVVKGTETVAVVHVKLKTSVK